MDAEPASFSLENINPRIFEIRGKRVMLDSDLAEMYGVSTKRLNQQFKRNLKRFPQDFAFRLDAQEVVVLRSQIATSKPQMRSQIATASKRNARFRPWAFTEHGAIMLASVLNSPVAIEASVRVVRAFVYLREQISANSELARKFAELEQRLDKHDESIATLFDAIRQLLIPIEDSPKREIGFHVKNKAGTNGKARANLK